MAFPWQTVKIRGVRLVDFLVFMLEAHAQTLQRLAALFGEERLLEILENAGEHPDAMATPPNVKAIWFEAPAPNSPSTAYAVLEGAVSEMRLPEFLEFHLWAYPHYRAFIESPLELGSKIQGPGGEAGVALVDEAVAQAQEWIRRLVIPPELGPQAERAAHVPWLRFRAEVLKRIGRRPMGPVY